MLWAQRSLSAVTVACFSVIEPFTSMGAAAFLAGERLPLLALVGGSVVLVGVVIQRVTQRVNGDAGMKCADRTPMAAR